MQVRGSLSKHRNKWRIVISYYDSANVRHQKTFATGLSADGNKRKAEAMLQEKLIEFTESGQFEKDVTDLTVGEWVAKCIEKRRTHIRDTTAYTYNNCNRGYIDKYFGKTKLSDLSASVVDKFYKHLSQIVSDGTAVTVIAILQWALDDAVNEDLIPKNYARIVKRYKSEKDSVQVKHTFSSDELTTFLDTIKEDHLYPVVAFTVFYGIRRGEICGLTWDCIDFDNRQIHIKQTLCNQNGEIVFRDYCKTDSSIRTLYMPDAVYELLKDVKRTQECYRIIYKNKYVENEHDFVFTTRYGKVRSPKGLSILYGYLFKKYDLPKSRLHDLRHTAATMWFDNGATVPQVQRTLGHSKPSTTMDIYVHHLSEVNTATAEIMSNVLSI